MNNSKHIMSLTPVKRLVKVNGLVGQPSYKQLPNGKSVIQFPAYGHMMDNGNKSALEKALLTLGNDNLGVQVVKQRYPYLERNTLSQYTAFNTDKYPFARIHKGVFKKRLIFADGGKQTLSATTEQGASTLPVGLKGIKLELAGRLTTQRSIPRKTVANRHVGKMSTTQPGQYTAKNKLGAYTVKA